MLICDYFIRYFNFLIVCNRINHLFLHLSRAKKGCKNSKKFIVFDRKPTKNGCFRDKSERAQKRLFLDTSSLCSVLDDGLSVLQKGGGYTFAQWLVVLRRRPLSRKARRHPEVPTIGGTEGNLVLRTKS